jgi:tRNA pseudouridine65 synthase
VPLPILYRDDRLVAVHKPAGLLVHRSDLDRRETRFAVQLLRDQLGRPVWPLHRLDRGTSGVLLFALDADTARRLGGQFASGGTGKTYLAVVRGWPAESGVIEHPLAPLHDAHAGLAGDGAARPAVTRYRRLATVELPVRVDRYPSSRYALLELHPVTGRRHQLRRHLKHISHPIVGDATYGKGRHNRLFQERFGCRRLLLAAVGLTFTHPVSGAPLTIEAPPAEDFAAVLDALGWSTSFRKNHDDRPG